MTETTTEQPAAPSSILAALEGLDPVERYARLANALAPDAALVAEDMAAVDNALDQFTRFVTAAQTLRRASRAVGIVVNAQTEAAALLKNREAVVAELARLRDERDGAIAERDRARAARDEANREAASVKGRAQAEYQTARTNAQAELDALNAQIATAKAEIAALTARLTGAA